ncbi:UMTA [Colletotrichum fioriniae PJ7]|uniref:UMTA n=1 Tax=Colletotrichum fioriniae PJ7 TaxID=1445577 RepID=A0A010R712_9PEZI|nr:UMTA [Colletotrichum fioriniae PJ7]
MASTETAELQVSLLTPAAKSPSAKGSSPPAAASSPAGNANETEAGQIVADPVYEHEDLTEAETERRHSHVLDGFVDYWGPNDEKQNEGLDLAHYWECIFFDDKLFLAPIGDSPQKVLDIGTGTGIWAIDFADEFPSAEVTGVDISPIQPSWVPPNCKFQIDDIEAEWTWPTEFFDYIHIRHLEGCVSDWPKLYSQAFEHLIPGGYVEVNELDLEDYSQALGDDLPQDHVYRRWAKIMFESMDKLGKTGKQTRDHGIANGMRNAGFVDIVEKSWPIPIGGWASDPKLKEVGAVNLQYIDQSLEGFGTFLLRQMMGWEDVEILVFMSEMRKALRDLKLQTYFTLHVVYGRKPEESDEQAPVAPAAAVA